MYLLYDVQARKNLQIRNRCKAERFLALTHPKARKRAMNIDARNILELSVFPAGTKVVRESHGRTVRFYSHVESSVLHLVCIYLALTKNA